MIVLALLMAQAACTPEHATMGHCTLGPPRAPAQAKAAGDSCPPAHAKMGHCTPNTSPVATPGPLGTDLSAGNGSPPPTPKVDAADRVWGAEAMRGPRAALYREHGGGKFAKIMADEAELRIRDGRDGYAWDAEGWFGGDIDKLVVKSEGEATFGQKPETVELQALWGHAIGPYFDVQAGVRHDVTPNPSRTHIALGVEGLAPYWFEIEGAVFLSNKGEFSARIDADYDQRITQRLILQPKAEVAVQFQDVPELGLGAGISALELGLRLRYEIVREFAPYIGVAWERKLGDTARFARAAGEDASTTSLLAGVRFWF